jgi:predicted amidohydrolase
VRKGAGLTVALILAAADLSAEDSANRLKVAAVQFRSTFDIGQNAERIAAQLRDLAKGGVQVAAFPECALTGYTTRADFNPPAASIEAAERQLGKVCREEKIAAIIGSVYKVNGHAYDTAVVFDSHGEMVERFGKVYLAGEKWARPGNHVAFFELDGMSASVIVCHDERYPELVRLPALAAARVVYYISSESGLRQESKLAPYRAQIMARAVENGVSIVQANAPANPDLSGSHGQSRIIAADGNVVKEASYFGEDIVVDTLDIAPRQLRRPLEGLLGAWWKEGVDAMLSNRHRPLD